MLSMCQFFVLFCFPGESGITKIKDIKDVLGDVCCVYMMFMVNVDVLKRSCGGE